MNQTSARANRFAVVVVVALGGLFAAAFLTNQAQAQIPPPPRMPRIPDPPRMPDFPRGIHGGDGIQGGIGGNGIPGGIHGGGGIPGGGIHGGGIGGMGRPEWVFTCSRCGREVGRGPSRFSADHITRCPHCGAQFAGGVGGGGFFARDPIVGPGAGGGGGGAGFRPSVSGPSFGSWFGSYGGGWEDDLLWVVGGLVGVALVLGGIVAILTLMNRQAMQQMEVEYEA